MLGEDPGDPLGQVHLWDHCFELPDKNLAGQPSRPSAPCRSAPSATTSRSAATARSRSTTTPAATPSGSTASPPAAATRRRNIQKIFEDNTRTVGIRMQQETHAGLVVSGEATAASCAAGHKFTLDRHFNGNGPYVLTRVEHTAGLGDAYTSGTTGGFAYDNTFQCIPFALPFRPARTTPSPRSRGRRRPSWSARRGQEIFTDKYGRVKVQFPWDRAGQNDANSSCWIRVATLWAGKQWGMIHIPRIGQEVDRRLPRRRPRPADHRRQRLQRRAACPPTTLPDNMTQSGIISRSTPKGPPTNFNQLRFEDKKGSEQIYVHAEKDFNRVVENNDTLTVGSCDSQTCPDGSQTIAVYKDRTASVETGNEVADRQEGQPHRHRQRGERHARRQQGQARRHRAGQRHSRVKQGNRTVNVKTGNDTHEVKTGNRVVTVDTGNDTHEIKTGNRAGHHRHGQRHADHQHGQPDDQAQPRAPARPRRCSRSRSRSARTASRSTRPGITLKGMMVKVQGQAMVQVKGPMVQVSGDAMLMLKGGITMIN